MQMVKKIVTAVFLIWFVLILFMPKEEIYFKVEQELAKHEIVLNEESRREGLFSLDLTNVTIYVKGIPLVTVEELSFFTLLLYHCLEFKTVYIDESLKNMTPTEIENLRISHGIWSPLNLSLDAKGVFGEAAGSVNLKDRTLHLDFNDTKSLEMISSKLKQGEEGWYYETSF